MKQKCEKCDGHGYIPCKKCKSSGLDPVEISGVCIACGGPGRFPCHDCGQTGKVENKEKKK